MKPERTHPPRADPPPRVAEPWQGEGFGLLFSGRYPVIGLAERESRPLDDTTALLLDKPPAALPAGERVHELRYSDGRLGMAIDDFGDLGLVVSAPRFGSHHISSDGTTVRSRPARLPAWRWQRLLIGQVLPLVAALRGLEVLHASAIARDGCAFALTGDSGAGKSTLAAQLVLRGNRLLADDVLAISLSDAGIPQAHRGSTALSVGREDAEIAAQLVRSGTATAIGSDAKEHVLLPAADRALALAAVYLLSQDDIGAPPIGAPRTPTLSDLMSATYVRYLHTPARLTSQLEVQSAVARHCQIVPVNVGAGLSSAQLAAQLQAHMTTIASGNAR
jgi:hypothetical protein